MASLHFRTIAFDLDGTVADTAPDLAAALNHALQSIGREAVSLATVRTMIGQGTRALLRRGLIATGACDDAIFDVSYPFLMDHYERHICDLTRPYPNVEAALDALAVQDVQLAICTNKPEHLSRLLVDALGWQGRFAAIVGGDTLAASKPDPRPLLTAIELAGGGPAAFVGDSMVDVATASAAGVPSVAVTFGYSDQRMTNSGADRVIDDFADLIPALSSL